MSAPALTIARANRLTKATERMNDLLKAVGDESFQRSQMRLIENDLAHAGYAIGDFLADYFRNIYAPATPEPVLDQEVKGNGGKSKIRTAMHTHQCKSCKYFFTPSGLNGHGEKRCFHKQQKSDPSQSGQK